MKKRVLYLLVIMLCFLAGTVYYTDNAMASSAVVELSTDSREITVGQKLSVYITITSDIEFGDFEANLTYDEEVLDYKGTSPLIAGSNGFLKISDMNVPEGDTLRKYALEFEALKVGVCEVALMEPFMVYGYDDGAGMPVSVNALTIQVNAAETASDNAYLSSLKISPSLLYPTFDRNIFSYETSVEYDTERLIINADCEDEKSIIRITGNDSLKEGENKVVIKVIAESGAVIEYTIDVFRELKPEETTTEEMPGTPLNKHEDFKIVRTSDGLVAINNGLYKLVEPGPEVRIPSGYIKTKMIISDISINVYAPENDLGSDFLLIYAVKGSGEADFYNFDKLEKTLQRRAANDLPDIASPEDNTDEVRTLKKEYRSNMMKAILIISLLSVLSAFLAFIVFKKYIKSK